MASGRDNHYAALGLTKSASADEIKKAFQNLAKELHPDVNPSPAADAAFARVKDAYDILRDKDKKATYDKMLSHYVDTGYNEEDLRRRAEAFRRAHQNTGAPNYNGRGTSTQNKAMRLVENMLRPRMLIAAPLLAWATWAAMGLLTGGPDDHGYPSLDPGDSVQAWFNPAEQRWETPAPWDPLYHSNRHTSKMVARRNVTLVLPPPAPTAVLPHPSSSASTAAAAAAAAGSAPGVHVVVPLPPTGITLR